MTFIPFSPFPNTAPTPVRYLTGNTHASPTATLRTAFGRQNLQHRIQITAPDPPKPAKPAPG
jgi:hypothetical protein